MKIFLKALATAGSFWLLYIKVMSLFLACIPEKPPLHVQSEYFSFIKEERKIIPLYLSLGSNMNRYYCCIWTTHFDT